MKYDAEVDLKYDPAIIAESRHKVKNYSKEMWQKIETEAEAIYTDLIYAMDRDLAPESPEVQAIIQRHYNHLNYFYTPTVEIYKGLGRLYVEDERFKEFFESKKKGLSLFISLGINKMS